jgi:hypothetical protein
VDGKRSCAGSRGNESATAGFESPSGNEEARVEVVAYRLSAAVMPLWMDPGMDPGSRRDVGVTEA